jgi:type IV secretion system protein VirB5
MSLFDKLRGRSAEKVAPVDPNPYLNARRQWNDHVGSIAASRRLWQTMAILSMLIVLACVGGIIAIGSQSKFVPYVVRVDQLGDAVASTRADLAAPVDARVVQAQVASFIQSSRMVTADVDLQKQAIFRVYAMLTPNDPAMAKMTDYLNGTPDASPFARAAKETVSVEINSVIQQTKASWQVDWTETERDRQGQPMSPPAKMRALVTVRIAPPTQATSEDQIHQNPLGVFVQDFSWSRTL